MARGQSQSEALPSLEDLIADFDSNQPLSTDIRFAVPRPAGPPPQPLQSAMAPSSIFPGPPLGPRPVYQASAQPQQSPHGFPHDLPNFGPSFGGGPAMPLTEAGPFDQWQDAQFLPSHIGAQPVEHPCLEPLDLDFSQINAFRAPQYQDRPTFQFSARQQPPQFQAPAERIAYSGDPSGETFLQREESLYLDSWGQSLTSQSASAPEGQADQGQILGTSTRSPVQQSSIQDTSKAPRRRGRPRLYDTTVPAVPEAEGEAQLEEPARKKRGAKPKYKYKTEAEAVANRRERNRRTAISSYYKKKHRDQDLEEEVARLENERSALIELERLRLAGAIDPDVLFHHLEEGRSGAEIMEMMQKPVGSQ